MKIVKMLAGLVVAALITSATAASGVAADPAASANDPLSVVLVAQSPIQPNTYCTVTAYASGGTGNYTYYWNASPYRITAVNGNEVTVRSSTNFSVTVTVFDGTSTVAETENITVSSNAASCPY